MANRGRLLTEHSGILHGDCTGYSGPVDDGQLPAGHVGIAYANNVCCYDAASDQCLQQAATDPQGACQDLHDGMGA